MIRILQSATTFIFSLFARVSMYMSDHTVSLLINPYIRILSLPASCRSFQYSAKSSFSSVSLFLRCSAILRGLDQLTTWHNSKRSPWPQCCLLLSSAPPVVYRCPSVQRPFRHTHAAISQWSVDSPFFCLPHASEPAQVSHGHLPIASPRARNPVSIGHATVVFLFHLLS
jgi:hypothetical protein